MRNETQKYFDTLQVSSSLNETGNNAIINNSISLRGIVKVVVEELDDQGNVISTLMHHKNNLVVDLGKELLCHLITAPQTNAHITTLKLGTKGHDLSNNTPQATLIPIAPKPTDASLIDNTDTFTKDFDGFTLYPTDDTKTEVQFSCVLEANEGNGTDPNVAQQAKSYTEAGMYSKGGVLFARETFPALVKTMNRRITFTWSILF